MSFQACFQCGIHAVKRSQSLGCDHRKYSYDWKGDIPEKLDAVTPEKKEVKL